MKTTILNVLVGFAIILLAMAMGCWIVKHAKITAFEKQTTTAMSVLSDITDSLKSKPDSKELISMLKLQDPKYPEMWNGVILRTTVLSDVDLNRTEQISLPAQNPWLSNEFERAKEIDGLKKQTNESIKRLNTETGKRNSSLIQPILNETTRLKQSKADIKILLVYSNLMENTSELNLYKKRDFDSFTKAGLVSQGLEKSEISLTGVKIYFVYEPVNSLDNSRYLKVSEILKTYFEDMGATVYRQANFID